SVCIARHGFGRKVVVAPAVETLAKDFPDQQAPPGLELSDISRCVRLSPLATGDDRLVSEFCLIVQGEPVIRARDRTEIRDLNRGIVVEDQLRWRIRDFVCMAGSTTAVENRFDVAEILDVVHALLEADARFPLHVPLLAGLVARLGGQERSASREVKGL